MSNYKTKLIFLLLVFLSVNLIHCQKSQDPEIRLPVDEESFVKLYAEIMIIKTLYPREEDYTSRFIPLLKKNKITLEKYELILSYYQTNPDRFLEFLDKVSAEVDSMAKENRKENPEELEPFPG